MVYQWIYYKNGPNKYMGNEFGKKGNLAKLSRNMQSYSPMDIVSGVNSTPKWITWRKKDGIKEFC